MGVHSCMKEFNSSKLRKPVVFRYREKFLCIIDILYSNANFTGRHSFEVKCVILFIKKNYLLNFLLGLVESFQQCVVRKLPHRRINFCVRFFPATSRNGCTLSGFWEYCDKTTKNVIFACKPEGSINFPSSTADCRGLKILRIFPSRYMKG